MSSPVGVALIVIGGALAVSLVTWWRDRFAARAADLLAVAAGLLVASGGLLVVGGANVWSWLLALTILGLSGLAQRRALLAPGGPFRT